MSKEAKNGYLFRELREPVPEDQKGAFEPWDRFNRWTQNKSKDVAIVSGAGTLIFPGLLPLTIGSALWHLGDRLQGAVSRGIRNQFEKAKGESGFLKRRNRGWAASAA